MTAADRRRTRIVVAAATYRRPEMLRRLLDSLRALTVPPDCDVSVIIVDNDPEGGAAALCRAAGVVHVAETRRGIPIARNRALEAALAAGADAIAFIDDDEFADAGWLAALVGAMRRRNLQLVGGPVIVADETRAETPWQRLILSGIRARLARKQRAAERKAAAGRDGGIVIVTNNWLVDAGWLRASGVRFDESRRFTGGTDTLFYYAARRAGAVSGWAADARVHEVIPANRLSYRYQVHRARDQAAGRFNRKYPQRGVATSARWLALAALRTVVGVACLAGIVAVGGVAVVQSARLVGGGWGIVRAIARRESDLYVTGDGS